MDVYNFVFAYFKNYSNIKWKNEFTNENYFELGIFDSFGFVKLIAELESEFDIFFTEDELSHIEFQTMNGIVTILEKKLIKNTVDN